MTRYCRGTIVSLRQFGRCVEVIVTCDVIDSIVK